MIILQISDRYVPRGPIDSEFFITLGIIIGVVLLLFGIGKVSNFISTSNKEIDEAREKWNSLSYEEQRRIKSANRNRSLNNIGMNIGAFFAALAIFILIGLVIYSISENDGKTLFITIIVIIVLGVSIRFYNLTYKPASPQIKQKLNKVLQYRFGLLLIVGTILFVGYKFLPENYKEISASIFLPVTFFVFGIIIVWRYFRKK